MKKLLLSLMALLCVMVGKANIVESFANASWLPAPDNKVAVNGTYTSSTTGIAYTLTNCKVYADYLMVQSSTGALEFALPEGTSAFAVKTGTQASQAVTITVTIGETAIETNLKLENRDYDYTFDVPAALQDSKETCKIAVSNNKNAQFQSITFVTEGGETPVDPDPVVPDDPVDTKVTSIKALIDATEGFKNNQKTDELELDFAMTVTYANGKYTYVTDGTDNLLIFGELGVEGLENGKVIPAGVKGKMTLYNGLPELTDVVTTTIGALTDGTPVEPVAATVANVAEKGMSAYVKLEDVTISDISGSSFTISDGDDTVAGYNTFKTSVAEGSNLTIEGIVSYFNKYQISPITITAADGKETVAAPTFNPAAGEVEAGATVTISTLTEGASIYYTLDGTAPTAASTLYEAPVAINEALTIKAIAVKEGWNDSEVAEAAYTVKAPADASFNFTKPNTLTPPYPADNTDASLTTDGSSKSATVSDVKFTSNHVSVVSTKGTSTDAKIYYRTSDTQLRVYNGATMTFTTDEPTIHLAKIVFGFTNTTNIDKITVAEGEGTWNKDDKTWTGDLRKLTLNIGGNIQINTIEVYTVTGDPIELEPDPIVPDDPEATKVASIKALIEANKDLAAGDTSEGDFVLDFPVTVIYSNGVNNYVTDGTDNLLIYTNLQKTGLENGKVLPAGITGKFQSYNTIPELKNVDLATVGDPTDGTAVEPVAATVDQVNTLGVSAYVKLEGVAISGVNGKNFTVTEGEKTLPGYNTFNITLTEGENLTVTGFVTYKDAFQIAPVAIESNGGETPVDPEATKVASIKELLDANKDVAVDATSEGEFVLDFPVTVIYSNGANNYVTDGKNNLLIYTDLKKEGLVNGSVLPAGITGKYQNYKTVPELKEIDLATVGEPTEGTAVEPIVTTVEDANAEGVSAYIVMEGVAISGISGKNFTITDEGGNTIAGYDTFTIGVAAGQNLTIVGFVNYYDKYQISPVSITAADGKETVAAPTFNPAAGELLAGTKVNIYTTTADASIYYTLDGTTPTTASTPQLSRSPRLSPSRLSPSRKA